MANTYLTRTLGTPTNRKIWTLSMWVKRSNISSASTSYLFSANSSQAYIYFNTNDTFNIEEYTGGWQYRLATNRVFRDTSAWYHVVISFDSTNGTADDRIKIYINGVQETSFSARINPSSNFDGAINNNNAHFIGREGASYWSGSMSHIHFIDGTAYDASAFGETDANGVWKINTSPSVTYGTNGFFILKDGNSVTDQSGNSNNFTVGGGTLTNTEDCPSNVFCTLNPLSTDSGVTLSSGNTESDYDASVGNAKGTLGFSSGKFYWEAKIVAAAGGGYPMIGIGSLDEQQMQQPTGGSYPGGFTNSYGAFGNGVVYANSSNTGSQGFTYTTNDIIGIAVDLDSVTKTIKWYKNGSQIATYNITTVAPFTSMDYNGAEAAVNIQYNFGNGYFGTTAVASAGTNASGIGIFEYDVPAGYTALSTKGLNL
jgi:hypothetical protein